MPNAREVLYAKRAGDLEEYCTITNATCQSWRLMHTPRKGRFRFRFVRVACHPSKTYPATLQFQHHDNDVRRTYEALYYFRIHH